MLSEDLPSCPHCGGQEFQSWGANIGPGFSQQGFKCPCGTYVKFIGDRGGNLLTFFRADQQTTDEYDAIHFPKEWGDWVNGALMPTWRDFSERWEAHKKEEWNLWLAKEFYPRFPEFTEYGNGQSRWTYYDLPDEAQKMIDDQFGGPNVVQRYGEYLPFPPELQDVVVPPRAPEGFDMYYRDKNGDWIWVDPKQSAKLEPPEDPILRRNREFFDAVWSRVGEALGTPLPAREEAQNEYGGIEPWHTFTFGGAAFKIGWRKRVVSINVRREEMFSAVDIRDLAKEDNVTYEAFKGLEKVEFDIDGVAKTEDQKKALREMYPEGTVKMRDGGYKAKFDEVNEVLVHAWGQDKTVEYLTALCQAVG